MDRKPFSEEMVERMRNAAFTNPNNDHTDSYCILGIISDISNQDQEVKQHKYKPTMKQRIRNLRINLGYRIGSLIAGNDIRCECADYDY